MRTLLIILSVLIGSYTIAQRKIIVAADGTGDVSTIQAAFDAIPLNNKKPVLIFVKNGLYREKMRLDSSKCFVTLQGEDKFKTILSWNDHTGKLSPKGDTINTFTSETILLRADDFTAIDITFENTAGFTAGQAVAVQATGDRLRFINCRFIGNQDVLFANISRSRQYYRNCYIEGTTDFIFGSATAWFEQCHIHSKKNSHVTAASTPQEKKFGYIFNDCVLTGDTTLRNVSLGRPWRPYAHTVFMNSYIGQHIRPEGWSNWNNTENYKTTRYAEYNNSGPSADTAFKTKLPWIKKLTEQEAGLLTPENVLGPWIKNKK